MRDETLSRNYAEALFELASRHGDISEYQEGIETVAKLLDESRDFRVFMETPRIDAPVKKDLIRRVFGDRLPKPLLNFVLITVDKRRQRLLRGIARQYHELVDQHLGRTHVEVTMARPVGEEVEQEIATRLSEMLDTQAIPHIRVKPEILGGIVVRTGDQLYDGSIRRRLAGMRRHLQEAELND